MKLLSLLIFLSTLSYADVIAIPSGGGSGSSISTPVSLINGGTGTAAASANAAFNALSPMTTGGDLIYGGASGAATRLANGTDGQILTSTGTTTAPAWEDPPAGSSQWTTDGDGIYYAGAARMGDAGLPSAGTTAVVIGTLPGGVSNQAAFFRSNVGANGAMGVLPLGDVGGTKYDFSVDFQGFTSANDNVAIMNFNRQGGVVNIGSGASTVRLDNFGAGSLTTDADGLIIATSDGRLKNIVRDYKRGAADLKVVSPKVFKWTKESGYDTKMEYSGFIAQNLAEGIPEAVTQGPDGYLAVQDRPVIAALVNAVNELSARLEALEGPKVRMLKTRALIPARQKSAPKDIVQCIGSKKFCENMKKKAK